jgi:alkanesulfonate monooxygenase SsuD/methylene tetrahydromethanopterin reductase-like flavin-dependent oxidoreductase (luciferase family)
MRAMEFGIFSASITRNIRLGTAVVVLPLYNPARLAAEIATAAALSNGRLMLGIGLVLFRRGEL